MMQVYNKGSITIIISYGTDKYTPDKVKSNEKGVPYIKYENTWYKIKPTIKVQLLNKTYYMNSIEYLVTCNYTEELFLSKLLEIIV